MPALALTKQHLQIPAKLAADLANKGCTDEEEIESVCWHALAKGCSSFDPGKLTPRPGQSEDRTLGIYLLICARREIQQYIRYKTRHVRMPAEPPLSLNRDGDQETDTVLADTISTDHRTGRSELPPQSEDDQPKRTLEKVLLHLDERDQEILLAHIQEVPYREIGERFGLCKESVRQRLCRIQRLARRLRDEGLLE